MSLSLSEVLYEAGIYIYALSLLFFFSDCIRRNSGSKRIGTGLLVVVTLLQVIILGIRAWQEQGLPIVTIYDFIFVFVLLLQITSLLMSRSKGSEFAVTLLSVIGFSVQVLNQLWEPTGHNPLLHWEAVQGMLLLHIILAVLSFAAFTVSAVFSVMYLFLHHRLKEKKWNDTVRRLPSLEMMDRTIYLYTAAGVPLLGVSLLVAVVSIIAEGRLMLLLDLKVISTGIGFCIFLYYFAARHYKRHSATFMAWWVLLGYVFTIANIWLNSVSDFHSWTGV